MAEEAKIHLDIFGQPRAVSLTVKTGPTGFLDLLEVAKQLCHEVSAIAVEHAEGQGRSVSCRPACGACCRQLVPVSSIEALSLAQTVAAMPSARRQRVEARFTAAIAALEAAGLVDSRAPRGRSALLGPSWETVSRRYFELQIACPFLEEESCGIYPERPLVCREYLVTTPASACRSLSSEVHAIERPVRMSEALATAAHALAGIPEASIPLVLALEWASVNGAQLAGPCDGEASFWALMKATAASNE